MSVLEQNTVANAAQQGSVYQMPGQAVQNGLADFQTSQVPASVVQEEMGVVTLPFPVPDNAVKLSSGVYVIFTRLNRSISTDLTIRTFNNVNLDKNGNVLTANMNTKDQMNMARSISDYHSTLIQQGVELVGDIDYYVELLDMPRNWAKRLRGLISDGYYDINDSEDIEFLFLRYYAFQNEEDWALLSQNTLNT